MVVFFDKENYINYLKDSQKSEIARDTLRMIKNQLDIHLNFKLEDLDDYEIILHEEFEEGVSVEFKITKDIDKLNRPLNNDSFPLNDGIYLVNDDAKVNKIKSLHTILIGSLNEEVDTLQKLIINHDYSFHSEKVIGTDITTQNHINILDMPFSTLVIVDRYMFKGPEIGGNIGLYEYNLDKILKKIFLSKSSDSHIVFVYQVNVKEPRNSSRYDEGPNLEKLANKIKKVVGKHCPKPEISFIGVPAGYIEDEHDRYILSNYLRIKSGDCMVYFDSKGKITTKSKALDYYSLGFRQYRNVNQEIISKLNRIVHETLTKHPKYSKVSDFSNFEQIINFS
jgi:hypothetical protein